MQTNKLIIFQNIHDRVVWEMDIELRPMFFIFHGEENSVWIDGNIIQDVKPGFTVVYGVG